MSSAMEHMARGKRKDFFSRTPVSAAGSVQPMLQTHLLVPCPAPARSTSQFRAPGPTTNGIISFYAFASKMPYEVRQVTYFSQAPEPTPKNRASSDFYFIKQPRRSSSTRTSLFTDAKTFTFALVSSKRNLWLFDRAHDPRPSKHLFTLQCWGKSLENSWDPKVALLYL